MSRSARLNLLNGAKYDSDTSPLSASNDSCALVKSPPRNWAGHASVSSILNGYGHMLPGAEQAVMDRLDAMQTTSDGNVIPLPR